MTENKFEKLLKLDLSGKTEKKKTGCVELTYLSWSYAWDEFKKVYPQATYEIKKFENNLPYTFDVNTGYMVFTSITADDLTYEMWLPVMDGANKAMKNEEYTYSTKFGNKKVEQATMFDINKTIMRCLVKNMAMFGLGLYIFKGEDLPDGEKEPEEAPDKNLTNKFANTIKERELVKEVVDDLGGVVLPSLEEVKNYIIDNNYSGVVANKFYDYYSNRDWKDSKGKLITDWKAVVQVWQTNSLKDNK